MKKIISSVVITGLLITNSALAFADNSYVCKDEPPNITITSHASLERALYSCKSRTDVEKVFESADEKIVQEHYEELLPESMEVVNNLPDGLVYENQETIDEVVSTINGINMIKIKSYSVGQVSTIIQEVFLDNNTKYTTTLVDAPEAIDSSAVMASPRVGPVNFGLQMRKDVGKRYTTVENKLDYKGYPITYLKSRIHYELHANKKISGRSIEGFNDSSGNGLSGMDITSTDNSWSAKAANASKIKGCQNFVGNFYIVGIKSLTYDYKVTLTVTPFKWSAGHALVEITGVVSQKLR